jgi:hypothetical protein
MSVEQWVLRVADSDWTRIGLNWLRPAKHTCVWLAYVVPASLVLGLPGVAAGAALIAAMAGRIDLSVCLWLLLIVTMVGLPLNLLFAHYWNRRARSLGRDAAPLLQV